MNIDTNEKITWCPGCGDFGILNAFKSAIKELIDEGIKKENIVIASGIGCHAKIVDYVNVNSFYSLHGRTIPPLTGMKLANKNLKLIGFSGDGDCLDEGISHLIHAAKRNIDITIILHNNNVFALTVGQATATSPKGFKGKSTPKGSIEEPLNPIKLVLVSGATFVARGYAGNLNHLKQIIKKAVKHKGFSFVEVLQPCVIFNNNYQKLSKAVYDMNKKGHNISDMKSAMKKSEELNGKIPIGIFYKTKKQTFDEHY